MSLARARTLGVPGSLIQSVLYAFVTLASLSGLALLNSTGLSYFLSLLVGFGFLLTIYAIEHISKFVGDRSIIDGIVAGLAFQVLSDAFDSGNVSLLGVFGGYFGKSLLSLDVVDALRFFAYLLFYVIAAAFILRSSLLIAKKLQLRFFRIAGLAGLLAALSTAIVGGLLFVVAYPLVAVAFLSLPADKAEAQAPNSERVLKVKIKSGQLSFSDSGILEIKKIKTPFLSNVTTAALTAAVLTGIVAFPLFLIPSYLQGPLLYGILFAVLMFVLWMSRRRFPTLSSENTGEKRTMIPWESVSRMDINKKEFSMQTTYGTIQARLSRSNAEAIAATARWKLRERLVVKM